MVRAAAGCGKTTDLAQRYLGLLKDGIPADQAVAITFTRRAAAELEERVALALRACLEGPAAEDARRRLGSAWPVYAAAAPREPELVRAALAALPDAPIGTTDAFVQRLLTEHALDAALPVPGGRVPLDLPITPRAGVARALKRAARRILDPPDGSVDADVALLARYLSLDELAQQVSRRAKWEGYPLATTADVLGSFARACAEALLPLGLAARLKPSDPADPTAWAEAIGKITNQGSAWAIPEVSAWLARGGAPADAPFVLCGWLVGLHRGRARALVTALEGDVRACGPGDLSLWEIVQALRYPYDDPRQVALADALRAARERLRLRVVGMGLREAALAGELDHDALVEAAIELCRAPPSRLRGRFRAILVDEVQDANPAQLRLYRALASHEGTRAYFVGDARQSIYLFRDAEPEGIRELERESERHGQAPLDLVVNRRSAPLLVEAHRELFGRISLPMREQRWRPIDDLARIESDPGNASLALDPAVHQPPEPVWIVTDPEGKAREQDLDERALRAFYDRVTLSWSGEPGHARDTAVVLTNTWARAREACDLVRAWAGHADAAFVEGGAGRTESRIGDDVALWLRALVDPSDEIAWVGVWKHPSVGLSDPALARAVKGIGLVMDGRDGPTDAPGWCRRPPWLADVDRLASPHDEADVLAFERARDAIREARGRIGRTATATVLDRLWTRLRWRTVLAAGPGGPDEVAELEVTLDRIRDLDADGQPPDAILAALGDETAERPQVHVERPAGHVVCTTVFQSKGLAWDHVCVLRVGRHARRDAGRDVNEGWMRLPLDERGGDRHVRLDGIRFDPHGGLSAFRDPLGRLAGALYALRDTEEAARLAYVAITRARRSVTFGLGRHRRAAGRTGPDLVEVLGGAWLGDEPIAGVARVPRPAVPPPGPPAPGWTRPTAVALPEPIPEPVTRNERAPSSLGAHLDADGRRRHAENVVGRVRLANGLHLGGRSIDPPAQALPRIGPADWGNLAHGWFAEWRFQGPVEPTAVEAWLRAEWGGGAPDRAPPGAVAEVVRWLVELCAQLAAVGGPVWALVTDPAARLWFEHPLLGLGIQEDREVLLSGRMDLLVERARGRLAVVDFKAGGKLPTGWGDLVEGASLRTYGFQLDAYGDALRRMGRQVDTVALWFVRTGTSVRWTP